jgi:putative transposase
MHCHGKTVTGKERYRCPQCKKTSTIHRPDIRALHIRDHFVTWLIGKSTKAEIASTLGITRQALTKQFSPLFLEEWPPPKQTVYARILIVDGTYIHGNTLCTLIAIDEDDNLFWKFVTSESYLSWLSFLSQFKEPDLIVVDGNEALKAAVLKLWPQVDIQRCQFHLIQRVHKVMTRTPSSDAGKELLKLLYELKKVKNTHQALLWRLRYKHWEAQYAVYLKERDERGAFIHKRVRSARLTVRRTLPYIFTFLDHSEAPNTTNLVEGWPNAAIAEALRRHRGLHLFQKKTLVSIILSHLHRGVREKPTRKFP